MPTELRGDARDLPQLAGHTPDDLDRARPAGQGPRGPRGAAGSATSPGPAPATSSRSRPGAGRPTSRADWGPRRTCAAPARRWRPGVASPTPGATWWPRARSAPTPTGGRPDLADLAPHRRGRASPRGGRSGCAPPTPTRADDIEDVLELDRVQQWDDEIDAAARGGGARPGAGDRGRRCPRACRRPRWRGCATTPRRSPATWPGRCRARRRRRPGSAPASTPGWRPGSASSSCSTPTICPGRADAGIEDDADLAELWRRSSGVRSPTASAAARSSRRSRWCSTGRSSAAGSTRSTATATATSSSTGRPTGPATADPLQLAIYRLAWAELHDVPLESVRAAFYYVRTGELVEPPDLPSRDGLVAVLDPAAG